VFGIADEEQIALLRPVARALLARDALRSDDYGGLSFGPGARPILKGEERVELVIPPKKQGRRSRKGLEPADDPLMAALRARRREIAAEAGVPPYVIFHDSTLREIAAQKPLNRAAFARIAGVGASKLERFAEPFIAVVAAHQGEAHVPAA